MKKIVIYQVLPRLFGNTNLTNKPGGTLTENGSGTFSQFNRKALQSIRGLGCTHLWYTGVIEHATCCDFTAYKIAPDPTDVIKGYAGSPYAIKDYYDVNPYLATDPDKRIAEFEGLITRTHEAGMGTIIDFVPNHLARNYHSDVKPTDISDFGSTDRTEYAFSPSNNFYYMPGQSLSLEQIVAKATYVENPACATGNDCFSAYPSRNDWYETVKLNYGVDYLNGRQPHFDPVPNTWEKMRHILLYWAQKGVDGFRCDMVEMVPVEFWAWVIPRVKKFHPNLLFIAEVYNPAEYHNYLFRGGFDYLYDKVGMYDTLRDIVCGHQPASRITYAWQNTDPFNGRMLHFMENHDEQRISSDFFCADPLRGFPSMVVSTLIDQAPIMLYAGQEIGEKGMDAEGFSGRDGRTTIFDFWSVDTLTRWYNDGKCNTAKLTTSEKQLRKLHTILLNIASSDPIASGEFHDLMYLNYEVAAFNSDSVYAFIRYTDNKKRLIVVNFSDSEQPTEIRIPLNVLQSSGIQPCKEQSCTDLFTDKTHTLPFDGEQTIKLQLKPFQSMVLAFDYSAPSNK